MLSFGDAPLIRIVIPSCIPSLLLSDLGHNLIAEPPPITDGVFQRGGNQPDIHRVYSHVLQSLDVADIVRGASGEHFALTFVAAARTVRWSDQNAQCHLQGRRIATGPVRKPTKPL